MKKQFDFSKKQLNFNASLESDAYYNTREVAEMLGLSLGTVQKMVERGALQAWKTAGGHRRILGSSIEDFLKTHQQQPNTFFDQSKNLSVLLIEDNPSLQKHYEQSVAESNMPINLSFVNDGLSAFVEIAKHSPDILITDLCISGVDGLEMINTIRKDPWFDTMDIIVVTTLNKIDIDSKGLLPKGVTVFYKPMPFNTLYGYVSAKLALLQRVTSPFPLGRHLQMEAQ
jgi:excisionase family DNA binding protein